MSLKTSQGPTQDSITHGSILESWLGLSAEFKRQYYVYALLGVVCVIAFAHAQLFTSISEFASFYLGGKFAGTAHLYDRASFYKAQILILGGYGDAFLFGRLPFYSVLLAPLSWLPYRVAFWAWNGIQLICVFAFILLWPRSRRELAVLVCGWSLPLFITFAYSQDDAILLLLLALAFRCSQKSDAMSGAIMSLFAIKFHLFLLLPLLLLTQRRWRMASGFIAGAVVLTVICFAASGWNWPAQMASVIFSKSILPREYLMPNLRGLLSPFTDRFFPEFCLDIAVIFLTWRAIRNATFEYGMAITMLGSLLISHHAGPHDCLLLIPVALVLIFTETAFVTNGLVLFLLTPVPYALLTLGGVSGSVLTLSVFALLLLCAFHAPHLPDSA